MDRSPADTDGAEPIRTRDFDLMPNLIRDQSYLRRACDDRA